MIALLLSLSAVGQTFPAKYYTFTTPGGRAVFLKKAIGDSLLAGHNSSVPAWAHHAIALAHSGGADSLIPVFHQFLADAYDGKRNDSAVIYYRKSLDHYPNLQTTKRIYLLQSLLYSYTGLSVEDSVRAYIHELEEAIQPLKDTDKRKLMVVNTLATSYGALNNYAQAIQSLRYVIRHSLAKGDTSTLVNALVNAGTAYNETGNDSMAVYYTLQALPYLAGDDPVRLVAYGNLIDYYTSLNKPAEARIFLDRAVRQFGSSQDEEIKVYLDMHRAGILVNERRYGAASILLERSLKYYEKLPPDLGLINALLIFVQLDTGMHDYGAAKAHLDQLYPITQGKSTKAYAALTLQLMGVVYARLGDYKSAYNYQQQYILLNDSLKSAQAAQTFALLQTEYQTYRREEQILKLNKEARIKDLELVAARRDRLRYAGLALLLAAFFGAMYHLRQQRNKATLRQVKASLEMKALRSQMNPHFIFNSLNSIQKYIWENRQEDAAEYLTRFARLIRLVLENSQHEVVPLVEELAALKLYIDMEHRRNNQKFDYRITVQEGIRTQTVLVPPLLIQPYVENAIWHGLSQKEERGMLHVAVAISGGALSYTITDDGIGRERAAQIKSKTAKASSMGMNISSERIAWLKRDSGKAASVTITDLYISEKEAAGTTVTIYLPLINEG